MNVTVSNNPIKKIDYHNESIQRIIFIEIAVVQQMFLTVVYIAIFFIFHKADAISKIVVRLILIFYVVFCGIERFCYYEYCQRKNRRTECYGNKD